MKKILLGFISLLLIASVGYCEEQPLQLIMKSDKEIYKVGEEIWIEFEFKNIRSERKDLLFEGCVFPLYHNFEFFDINGDPILHKDPAITCTIVVSERKELVMPLL
jgi:hypothetical protein